MRSAQDRGRRNDKKLAKKYKGRAQPASGALPQAHNKGDVKSEHFLIEAKLTDKESFNLKHSLLRKCEKEALSVNRMPVFHITYDSHGRGYVVLREQDFDELIEGYYAEEE